MLAQQSIRSQMRVHLNCSAATPCGQYLHCMNGHCSLHFKIKNLWQTEASSQTQHTRSYLIGSVLSTFSLVWNDQLTLANGAGKTKLAPHFITEEREILHFDMVVISPKVWEKHNMFFFFFSSWVNPLQPIALHSEIILMRYSKSLSPM